MHVTRCSGQSPGESLDEYYSAIARSDGSSDAGRAMLHLVDLLRAQPGGRRAFALAFPARLSLLAIDEERSPRFVILTRISTVAYYVQYLLPERLAPWPAAYVGGEARSDGEVVQMVLTAMERSEGWTAFF
jgi:hypothetical protein